MVSPTACPSGSRTASPMDHYWRDLTQQGDSSSACRAAGRSARPAREKRRPAKGALRRLVLISLWLRGRALSPGRAAVMAVVNRTADSFYPAARAASTDAALAAVAVAVRDGADLVDIGGVRAGRGSASAQTTGGHCSRRSPGVR